MRDLLSLYIRSLLLGTASLWRAFSIVIGVGVYVLVVWLIKRGLSAAPYYGEQLTDRLTEFTAQRRCVESSMSNRTWSRTAGRCGQRPPWLASTPEACV